MDVVTIVAGSEGKNLIIKFNDEVGVARVLTDYTIRVQGRSASMPEKQIDLVQTSIVGNAVTWAGFGNKITAGDLGRRPAALFVLRAKLLDPNGKPDSGPEFGVEWVAPPI
jgi:hypothetical protein